MEGKPRFKTIEDILNEKPSPPMAGFVKGLYLGARGNFMYNLDRDLMFCTETRLNVPHSGRTSKDHIRESLERAESTSSCRAGYVVGNLAAYPAIWAMGMGKYAFQAWVIASRMF